jgi:hypothetical protein
MTILDGSSDKTNAEMAIDEATDNWAKEFSPDILFAFHSSRQDAAAVAAILAERFPDSLIVGSTTAGEWLNATHQHDSLILLAIAIKDIKWSLAIAEQLDHFDDKQADKVCEQLLDQLGIHFTELNPEHHFCLSFFDGLCKREEGIVSMISSRLANTPLIGGSAGDDLKFENTYVIADGKAHQNAAVFVLADSQLPFKTIKHQHFVTGDNETIITKADISERTVYHLDGIPAAERYAQLLGIEVADLNIRVFSNHPLIYQYQRECYVRSIGHLGENNSLIFHCAIEEGMILNLCSHQNMTQRFKQALVDIATPVNKIKLMLMFNCTLRCVEAESTDIIKLLASEVGAISDHVFGFDTYGEQWNGLHINQTLVALAIYDDE